MRLKVIQIIYDTFILLLHLVNPIHDPNYMYKWCTIVLSFLCQNSNRSKGKIKYQFYNASKYWRPKFPLAYWLCIELAKHYPIFVFLIVENNWVTGTNFHLLAKAEEFLVLGIWGFMALIYYFSIDLADSFLFQLYHVTYLNEGQIGYSRVRNKHTGTLINFWGFFQGLRPY